MENQHPPGEMIWRLPGSDEIALHLRTHPSEPWRHYKDCPEFAQPDSPNFSEGYPTFVALLKKNWKAL
ncbi:hypothetical protein ACN4EG_14510 [Alkalinema pantanalense CENA528]|uniref:hypothetical protein n=1 Tax=Alkalinema pantanalense TaxID=1620705 RepID=UPI003D6F2985